MSHCSSRAGTRLPNGRNLNEGYLRDRYHRVISNKEETYEKSRKKEGCINFKTFRSAQSQEGSGDDGGGGTERKAQSRERLQRDGFNDTKYKIVLTLDRLKAP
ncbi:hypothetical protein HN011_006795 [Eciton burchellii]|nr:hypothetical protein HN011_006795 [Eciton burchellii]